MSHYTEMEDDEETPEQRRAKPRRGGSRFGPLLTIAVAILTLFGAASRLGKPQSGDGLFSLDLSASNRLEQDRIRSEEERLRTIVTLGAVPTPADSLRPAGFVPQLDPNPLPPERGEFALDLRGEIRSRTGEAIPLSMPVSGTGGTAENYNRGERFDPAPEALPDDGRAHPKTYTVQSGDNWVKVAQKTGKKWQDVQKANPASSGGLRVGMKLVIP
jgi:hypothetical protein